MTQARCERLREAEIAELKERVDIVRLIGCEVELRRDGRRDEWTGECPFHEDRSPSFRVYGVNGERPHYHCFGCGANGDALDWLMNRKGLTFLAAIERLRHETGSEAQEPVAVAPPVNSERKSKDSRRIAHRIWKESISPAGTVLERYWHETRAIDTRLPWCIRFQPKLLHPMSGRIFPALVAAVVFFPDFEKNDEVWSVSCTYLRPDGSGKADAPKPRLFFGSIKGGAVRLAEPDETSGILALAEGIETAASFAQRTGLPCWAALSAGFLPSVMLPHLPLAREVVIAADNDTTGLRAAQEAARKWFAEGRLVRIVAPKKAGTDFNDLLKSEKERVGT